VDQISISGNSCGDLSSEINCTRESLFNGFHCEVGMPPVNDLEKCYTGRGREVNVLCAISS
jgi:hypothetical protein